MQQQDPQLKQIFASRLGEAWRLLGRRDPGDGVVSAVVGAVMDAVPVDAGYIGYACRELAGLDRIPANLARHLIRIFPQYLAEGLASGGGTGCGSRGCRECGGTGWLDAWPAGATPGTAPTALPCKCNRIAAAWTGGTARLQTRGGLRDSGEWTFEEPKWKGRQGTPLSKNRLSEKLKAAAGKPAE